MVHASQLRREIRSRRLSLLMALATLIREAKLSDAEEVVHGCAVDLLDECRPDAVPTVTEVLAVIEQGPDLLRSAARASSQERCRDRVADLVFTPGSAVLGSLAGVFDGPTSQPINLDAPVVSVDLPSVGRPGTSC